MSLKNFRVTPKGSRLLTASASRWASDGLIAGHCIKNLFYWPAFSELFFVDLQERCSGSMLRNAVQDRLSHLGRDGLGRSRLCVVGTSSGSEIAASNFSSGIAASCWNCIALRPLAERFQLFHGSNSENSRNSFLPSFRPGLSK